ncbi:sub [Drosophila busckii]|uniref:Sub n=1 Tax=Drosophila busckii TaxID=30019 RepID=A0A0M4EVC7_DROBS|nr:kinesin-like protein subito [Drosophila busckii]ALC41557.1 sub [Drosophila busckii]
MDKCQENTNKRDARSFLCAREPSIDRRYRPRPNKQKRLFNEAIPESEDSLDYSDTESENTEATPNFTDDGTTADIKEIESGPQVFLRLRPVDLDSSSYVVSECGNTLIVNPPANENTSNNVNRMEKHYSFSGIFDSYVDQKEIYEKCVAPKILEEECLTLMTYGTSGSGKTYTLLGDCVRPGVIPRALENIFRMYGTRIYNTPSLKLVNSELNILGDSAIAKELQIHLAMLAQCPDISSLHQRQQKVIEDDYEFQPKPLGDVSVMIWVSFAEIYNEQVYDLLTLSSKQSSKCETRRKNLKIVGNNGKAFIKGLTSVFVKRSEEAFKLLRLGQQRLTYASTAVNANSSRSHCIFTLDVLKYYRSGNTTQCSYKFCDLAGSERVDKTGTKGFRLKEAQSINTSLMVLGRCLDAASSSQKKNNTDLIPYRESKLTMLLQAPLLGRERLAMIVTVTPLDKYYEENLNVVNFASIAKDIIFKQPMIMRHKKRYSVFAESNGIDTQYVERLEEENHSLLAEIERLRYENVLQMQLQEEKLRKELTDRFQDSIQTNLDANQERMDKMKVLLNREHEAKMAAQKRKYEEEIEDLREEIEDLKEELQELKSSNSDIEIIDDD